KMNLNPTAASGMQATEAPRQPAQAHPLLGGFAALAESAWMGFAQATEVLEPVRMAAMRLRGGRAALAPAGANVTSAPRARNLAALLTQPLTIAQATAMLMASFFLSALLGAVRQVLFN